MGWDDDPVVEAPWESDPVVDEPTKITPENWLSYAAGEIQRQQEYRQASGISGLTSDQQMVIQDVYRVQAGLEPVNIDALTRFYNLRKKRTEESAWANFQANFANTTLSFMGGFAQVGKRASDAVGLTDRAAVKFAEQQAEMGRVQAPGGGFSGFTGRAVGNLANVALLGGFTPGSKAAPVAGAFGLSAAGGVSTDVAQRRTRGEKISGGAELTAAVGTAAIETGMEMFGITVMKGLGRSLAKEIPAIAKAVQTGSVSAIGKAFLKAAGSKTGTILKASVAGSFEELATEIGQNIVKKYAYAPETKVFENVAEAAAQGAIMPMVGGVAAALMTPRGQTQVPPTGEGGPLSDFGPNVPGTEPPSARPLVRRTEGGGPLAVIPKKPALVTPPPSGTEQTYSPSGPALPRVFTPFPPAGSIQVPQILDLIYEAGRQIDAAVLPTEAAKTPDEVVDYLVEQGETAADVVRPMLGDDLFVLRDVPIGIIDIQTPTPEPARPAKAARAKARSADALVEPVVLGQQGAIVDGMHRIREARNRGEKTIPAWVPQSYAVEHGMANPEKAPALPQPRSVVTRESQIHPMPVGADVVKPHATYNTAEAATQSFGDDITPGQGRNPWIRPSAEATNEKRVLLIQFSTDLINADRPRTSADDYYDKLYKTRPGYSRPADFWELPRWIGMAARNLPNSDVYVVRDLGEARQFLARAGYGEIAFSALDVNSQLAQSLIEGYDGKVAVGGYADMTPFQGRPNVTVYKNLSDWTKTYGREFEEGTDYRHFRGTEVIPRLCLSTGCLHNCAFCGVAGKGKAPTEINKDVVDQQIKSFGDLKANLVYLDDKTFGQAKNHQDLIEIRKQLQEANPDFEGFIIQTSAAAMKKLTPEFIREAGIRYIEIGVESYNDSILKSMKKPASEKLIDEAVAKAREAGAEFIPNVLIGLPGETAETYARTLDFLNANADVISHVNAYNVALYEGSALDDAVGGAKAESDRNENVTQKSWQKTPEVDQAFHDAVMEFASRVLDRPVGDAAQVAQQRVIDADRPTPAAEPKPSPVDGFIRDEQGAVPLSAMGRAVSRIIAPVADLANGLMGEMAFTLRHSAAGRTLGAKLDSISTKAATLVGHIENQAAEAYHRLTRQDRQWLSAVDVNGYSNFQRLIEDSPSGPLTAPNEQIEAIVSAYRNMIDATGLEAVRVGVQAVTPGGEVIDFKQAQAGRFLRNLTPDAFMALHQGQGALFDAIAEAVARDNGVELAQAGEFLREWLGSESVRKSGQLERLRAIRNLPSAVDLKGSLVAIQETDPFLAIMNNAKRQARRIYFIEEFGQNIGGQETEIERLRAAYQRDGGNTVNFDAVLTVFEERPYKRVFSDPRNPISRAIRFVDSLVSTSHTSLSAVPNLPQSLILVPKYVGWINYLKAVGKALRHPQQTVAQLSAMGAMNRAIIDWTLRLGHGPEDLARLIRGVVARGTGLEALSQFNNMVAGDGFRRLADVWRKTGISTKDLAVAQDLRLTPAEINSINAGEMTQSVYNKIAQNGVKITQFITEDPHRKSQFQHVPLLNGLFAYNNYAIGTAKAVVRTVRETIQALESKDTRRMGAAAQRIVNLLAGSVGAGTISLLLRRAIKGQPPVREDEDLEAVLSKALWEVSLLGPTQRMQDAFEYSGNTTEKAMVNLSPKLVAIAQVVDMLRGGGRWGELPVDERVQKTVTKLNPAVRSVENWYNRLLYPKLETYRKVRSMAGAYLPRSGKVPDVPVNAKYYMIHTAILHDDETALQAALYSYQTWATEQGQDDDTARRNLRSALEARRPVAFRPVDYREFLATLSPEKRHLVETTQAHYVTALDEITLTSEEKAAQRGDVKTLSAMVQAGQINVGRARQVMRRADQTAIQKQLDGASFEDSLRIWAVASPEERVLARPQILEKARAAINRKPADQQAIIQRLRETGLLSQ